VSLDAIILHWLVHRCKISNLLCQPLVQKKKTKFAYAEGTEDPYSMARSVVVPAPESD
jgi:hypothetical protein